MQCFKCNQIIPPPAPESLTLGYANYQGQKICYPCCAEIDKGVLRETGRLRGYLHRNEENKYEFINFPGSLRIPIKWYKISTARINGTKLRRTDFWGVFEGREFHGVQLMNNGTLATIKMKK